LIHHICRFAVGSIWMYQGLVPKLLGPHADELAMAQAAGVPPPYQPMVSFAAGVAEVVFGVLLIFPACQAAMGPMRAQHYGSIINISSVLGKNGDNPRPWDDPAEQQNAANAAYGASKAGVHALTLFLARELAAHGITVNAVAPGPVASAIATNFPDTLRRLIPAGRVGSNTDLAAAVAFHAGERSAFITGEIPDVNGGMWCD
jgi:NAD(P)-dependent dehydrogenase (short-subunit alcohol dehydrogenase family)